MTSAQRVLIGIVIGLGIALGVLSYLYSSALGAWLGI